VNAQAENHGAGRIEARALILRAVLASIVARVIPLTHRHLLILIPALAGVEGKARVTVGAEASSNRGVRWRWAWWTGTSLTPCFVEGF
jgi:hypothetical protein